MNLKTLHFWQIPFAIIIILCISSCASIPKQAPLLSEELGKRISMLEQSHLRLLKTFFDQKRSVVDEFVEKEWVPVFAENIFANPKIVEVWNQIVSSGNKRDRLEFIMTLGPELQTKINQKRLELIQPLDELEREIDAKLREEYNQTRSLNNSITSYLYSASKVEENRQRYLDMMGVTDQTISTIINETDKAVDMLLNPVDKAQKAEDYINQIKDLTEEMISDVKPPINN